MCLSVSGRFGQKSTCLSLPWFCPLKHPTRSSSVSSCVASRQNRAHLLPVFIWNTSTWTAGDQDNHFLKNNFCFFNRNNSRQPQITVWIQDRLWVCVLALAGHTRWLKSRSWITRLSLWECRSSSVRLCYEHKQVVDNEALLDCSLISSCLPGLIRQAGRLFEFVLENEFCCRNNFVAWTRPL